jgi:ankyrin repeat protein
VLLAAGAAVDARAGYVSVVVKMRANLNCLQKASTPLHNACLRGHVEVISLLLAAGAAIEGKVNAFGDESKSELSSGKKDSPAQCL